MSAIKRVLTGTLALMLMCSPAALAAPRYNTQEAELGVFTRKRTYKGSVIYQKSASAAVYDSNAIMGEMLVEPGQEISAGDVISTYYSPISDVNIERAEIALAQAQDDYDFEIAQRTKVIEEYREAAAQADNETDARINELMAQREELELEKYRASADADIASLTAQRDAAVASSEPRYVYAPLTGTVAYTSNADAGNAVNGKEMAGIFAPETIIIRVSNPNGELKYGMKVNLELEGDGGKKKITGTVVSADNVLPGSLRTGMAYILPDEDIGTKAMRSANISSVAISVENAVIIPDNTLLYANGQSYVRILDSDGTVRNRYVRVAMTGDGEAWIMYGVEPGDKLIAK